MSATEWMGIITMKINNLGYLIKEGIRGIFLHSFMSFAAVCVTVACLLIVGSFSSLMYNLNIMVEDLNKTNEVRVFIDENLTDAEARSVDTQLYMIENVNKATFVSREQALQEYAANFENPEEILSGIRPQDLRHRYEIILWDNALIEDTVEQLRQVNGVADVSAEYELAEGFATLQYVLQMASILITIVLLAVSLLIISNTVKLAMYDRKDEIAIMKMVGATNGFIRLPFVVEGFLLGMTGAVIAFCFEWLLYDALVLRLEAQTSLMGIFNFVPFTELLVPMVLTFGGAGLFVGVVGSWTSIRKFMDV